VSVIGVSEELRETGIGIKGWKAQPVYRPILCYEGCGAHVSYQGVILDPGRRPHDAGGRRWIHGSHAAEIFELLA
jgi:hypothetical protein